VSGGAAKLGDVLARALLSLTLAAAIGAGCGVEPASAPAAPDPEPAPASDPASDPTPDPTPDPAPAVPTPTTDPAELERLALACDGPALAAALAILDPAALAATPALPPSVALLATWEAGRRFDADGRLDPAAATELVAALTAALGQAPPRWWTEQLASARRTNTAEPPAYELGLASDGSRDRRGPLQRGPGEVWVRGSDSALVASGDALAYDFSVARVELGPIPTGPDATVELARVPGASTIYYAHFKRGSGGFRFPLAAIGSSGKTRWSAEVCGPDRKLLGGLGYLIAEIVIITDPPSEPAPSGPRPMGMPSEPSHIAVFTGESHGVAVDVFDPDTGARTLAWSSDLWFAR
jgi:hypothetical protein